MGDVERIPTTERPLRDELARVLKREVWTVKVAGLSDAEANHLADAVLPILERERVRVVEGLVATIKALPAYTAKAREHERMVWLPDVLAVVEAAREDTTDG